MKRYNISFNKKLHNYIINCNSGFSLVELLVGMAVILIIAIAFTPLLLHSIERIHYSGHRSQALSEAQGEVEEKLSIKDAVDSILLGFIIDGEEFEVRGGLVDVEKEVADGKSELTAVSPIVPTITLSPSRLIEGYKEPIGSGSVTIEVTGYDTSFDGNSELSVYGDDGTELTGIYYSLNVLSEEEAEIILEPGLTNANSPYTFKIKTGDEITKGRLHVDLPNFLAVGVSATILASDYSESWVSSPANLTDSNPINSIIWQRAQYTAVGNNGLIINLKNREPWRIESTNTTENLNYITWGDIQGVDQYVAVGDNGTLMTSSRGNVWHNQDSGSSNDLNSVVVGNIHIVAVGNNGTILQSKDIEQWNQVEEGEEAGDAWELPDHNLNDVAYIDGIGEGADSFFIAVGDNGSVYFSTEEEGVLLWSQVDVGTSANLQSVTVGSDMIVVVGENGTIVSSSNSVDWVSQNSSISNLLNEVLYILEEDSEVPVELFVAVGNSGTILTSVDGITWIKQDVSTSNQLLGIACRY